MRVFFRVLARVAALIAMIVLLVFWRPFPKTRGELAARFDIAIGHQKILSYGMVNPWFPEYARLMRERYGIEGRMVAGCIVSESTCGYVESYDAVSLAEARRRYGRDIAQETMEEARNRWFQTYAKSTN
jgi:hypothetical protein